MKSSYDDLQINKLAEFWKAHGDAILNYGLIPVPTIETGVASNTLRALGKYIRRGWKKKPSVIFNEWAIRKNVFTEIIPDKNSYERFHDDLVYSLEKHWKDKAGHKLRRYPYAAKMVDLHVKHILWRPNCFLGQESAKLRFDVKDREDLIQFVFQPLDRYSLIALKAFGVSTVDVGESQRNIPKTTKSAPTMGFVDSREIYSQLQDHIRRICEEAAVPTFAFDYHAWNVRNPEVE